MLVFTRNPGERLRIGETIAVTVLGVAGGKVRLGIDAPKAVPIHRGEIYERVRLEQQSS